MMPAPICPDCKVEARLTDGMEIWPHRPDLHAKPIWTCDGCGGRVGCHPGTTDPLGTPAGPELRRARGDLHEKRLDPLWREALESGFYKGKSRYRNGIVKTARTRVYEWLADRLSLLPEQTHVGMFDMETCKRAWAALEGVSYADIRAWAHARRAEREAA